MNWKTLDESWKAFSQINNVDLDYQERNIIHAIECKYSVEFQLEDEKFRFTGILWKSTTGDNKSQTKISVKYLENQFNRLEFKDKGLFNIFAKQKLNASEKTLFKDFLKINGSDLLLEANHLNIELDEIICSPSEFEKLMSFINELKTNTHLQT